MLQTLFLVAIIVETLFYLTIFRGGTRRAKIIFITQAAITNLPVMIMWLLLRDILADPTWMGASTWIVLLFMVSFFTKLLIDLWFSLRWIIRRFKRNWSLNWMKWGAYISASITLLIFFYGAVWGRTELRVEHVEILSNEVPQRFDGYKIALFSDAHIGNFGGWSELVEDLVEQINEENPDIVVQGGDLVNIHSGELTDEFIKELMEIKTPVYSVIGNHDLAYYIKDTVAINPEVSRNDLIRKQKSMGWNLLENRGQWIYRGSDSILIGGVSFPKNHHHNGFRSDAGNSNVRAIMDSTKSENFTVIAAHSPSLFDSVYTDSPRPDLILSGHTHSMQTKIEIGDWKWSPAQLLYPNFSGLYEDRGHYLYVNDGLGYVVIPFRFGARPELTIITLKRQ